MLLHQEMDISIIPLHHQELLLFLDLLELLISLWWPVVVQAVVLAGAVGPGD